MNRRESQQSGVALLMALGMLALLSILGVTFSTNMRLMERTTRDFVYAVQARYLAEGGIEYAIAALKEDARNNFVYNNNVAIPDQGGLLGGIGKIEDIVIKDNGGRININYASKDLLDTVLNGVGSGTAQEIVNLRNGPDREPGIAGRDDDGDGERDEMDEVGARGSDDRPFLTLKSIDVVRDLYERNKDLITVWGYCDPNTQDKDGDNSPRPPVNLHTADPELISKLAEAINGVTPSEARTMARLLSGREIDSWGGFDDLVDSIAVVREDAGKIKDNFNPNRWKPRWGRNRASTELCFHSGGTYEVTVTGTVTKDNQILAKKTITTTAKIFDLLNQTTTEQFSRQASDYKRVTWLDSCPVNSNDIWTLTPSTDPDYTPTRQYYTVRDSLKLGYWDNFSDSAYSTPNWNRERFSFGTYRIGDYIRRPNNNCLIATPWAVVSLFSVSDENRWSFAGQEHYIHAQMRDTSQSTSRYYAAVLFRAVRDTQNDSSVVHLYNYSPRSPEPDRFAIWLSGFISRGKPVRAKPSTWTVFEVKVLNDSTWAQESYREINRGVVNEVSAGPAPDRSRPLVRIYNGQVNSLAWYDNIRVIGTEGNYTSGSFMPANDPVDWGTIYFTDYKSKSVKEEEKVKKNRVVSVKIQTGSTTVNSPGGKIGSGNSTSIDYKAILETTSKADYGRFETPVLEDVWITYLPKTKILYWREGMQGEVE